MQQLKRQTLSQPNKDYSEKTVKIVSHFLLLCIVNLIEIVRDLSIYILTILNCLGVYKLQLEF